MLLPLLATTASLDFFPYPTGYCVFFHHRGSTSIDEPCAGKYAFLLTPTIPIHLSHLDVPFLSRKTREDFIAAFKTLALESLIITKSDMSDIPPCLFSDSPGIKHLEVRFVTQGNAAFALSEHLPRLTQFTLLCVDSSSLDALCQSIDRGNTHQLEMPRGSWIYYTTWSLPVPRYTSDFTRQIS